MDNTQESVSGDKREAAVGAAQKLMVPELRKAGADDDLCKVVGVSVAMFLQLVEQGDIPHVKCDWSDK